MDWVSIQLASIAPHDWNMTWMSCSRAEKRWNFGSDSWVNFFRRFSAPKLWGRVVGLGKMLNHSKEHVFSGNSDWNLLIKPTKMVISEVYCGDISYSDFIRASGCWLFIDWLGNYSQQNCLGLLGILTNQYNGMTFLVLNAVHLNHIESKKIRWELSRSWPSGKLILNMAHW